MKARIVSLARAGGNSAPLRSGVYCGVALVLLGCSEGHGSLVPPGTEGAGGAAATTDALAGAGGAVDGASLGTIEYDGLNGLARNPIVSHVFTADPSGNAFDGRICVHASHDLDDQDDYDMYDLHVFSRSNATSSPSRACTTSICASQGPGPTHYATWTASSSSEASGGERGWRRRHLGVGQLSASGWTPTRPAAT